MSNNDKLPVPQLYDFYDIRNLTSMFVSLVISM